MNRSTPLLQFFSHRVSNHVIRRHNHYKTLGVDRTSSAEELKKAYFALSKKYHPDLVQNEQDLEAAVENFIKIQKAYDVLGDVNLKIQYDKQYSSSTLHPHEEKITDEEIRDILRRQAARKAAAQTAKAESTAKPPPDNNPAVEFDRPPIFRLLNYLYFAIALFGGSMMYLGVQKNKKKEDQDNENDTSP